MKCQFCGHQRRPGRGQIHDAGICRQPWYQRERGFHSLPPGRPRKVRPVDEDLPAAVIEAIMARRAAEQRYERAQAAGDVYWAR